MIPGLVIAAATIAGAGLARQGTGRRELYFGAAGGALLVIAGLHLLPDAWSAARGAGVPVWVVPAATVASFALGGAAVRRGCACQASRHRAGGAGAAAALAAHRLLEGAALTLAASVTVTIALAVHALAEGLAAGTLLSASSRRARVAYLTVMCAAPATGAALTAAWHAPAGMQPVLPAIAAGVLGQAARISLKAARPATTAPVAAGAIAAAVTALAVYAAG
jgi:hypothetical protein